MDQPLAGNSRTVDRDTLYREVWARPMTSVAATYGVSSSFLARVCKRLKIPRPPRGYWAKLEVGRAPGMPALPSTRPGDELEWSRDGSPPRVAQGTIVVAPDIAQASLARGLRRPTHHEVLADSREHFDAAKESDDGYLRPKKRCMVDMFLSRGEVDRALRLAKSLFRELEKHGHRVAFGPFGSCARPAVDERVTGVGRRDGFGHGSWSPDRPTVVYLGSVTIGLTIFEFSEEVEVGYHDGKYVRRSQLPLVDRINRFSATWIHKRHMPNGRLCIRATSVHPGVSWEKRWGESKKGELRSQIEEIANELRACAPQVVALVEEADRQAEVRRRELREQQERWQRETEERQRAQNLKASRDELFEIIEDWGIAKRTEDFFADIERRLSDSSDVDRVLVIGRLQRARALLGGTDALQRFAEWKSADERRKDGM